MHISLNSDTCSRKQSITLGEPNFQTLCLVSMSILHVNYFQLCSVPFLSVPGFPVSQNPLHSGSILTT